MTEATEAGAGKTDIQDTATDTAAPPGGPAPGWETAPGGPTAVERGCECSVLANAAFRARAEPEPLIDPRCPLHAAS